MTGIVFFRSAARERVCEFYRDFLDAETWLEQPGCTILRYDTFLFGFCDADPDGNGDGDEGDADSDSEHAVDRDGTITFVYDTREAVDRAYEQLADRARGEPAENEAYEIYNFFARDPEGREIECQTFRHPIDPPGSG